MYAGLIPLPSDPCFAMADIARIAIDEAVSNPVSSFSQLSQPKLVGYRFTKTEQYAHRVHLDSRDL